MIDYKRIIKSRRARLAILSFLAFVPDKAMISLQYRIKTGRKLNLNNPQRYTEKLQWYKLYYRANLMREVVDKASVRKYVKDKGYEEILIPLVGVFKDVKDIHISGLPNAFVIKDTLGGGGNDVLICKNKNELVRSEDWVEWKKTMKDWTKKSTSYKTAGREWVYGGKKHRVIIEQYLPSKESSGGLVDYKFFCFNGKTEYMYVVADRVNGGKVGLGIYDRGYNRLPYNRVDEKPLIREIEKPHNFDDMIRVAEDLAEPFPHARIDLYNVEGKIYFGEITFFDGSGYMTFNPDEFDQIMGDKFRLPKRYKD